MSHPDFELLHREPVPTLRLTVESYRHRATGAKHLHLAADDPHNCFLVAFLTVPTDSTGVAHILEHTALCGSRRYPVRDPFFMMLRRSLATFMNAFTSSDWTAYPFASQSRKDYLNLLEVYLDAAFFPNLAELDFLQEGCRVEFATPDDPSTPLQFKGVVFNEMKGALSSPARVLGERLQHHLYPTTTYHHNSGGEPEVIPSLSWHQLKEFHARHYHPSNAVFMTYGDLPAAQQQEVFAQRVLNHFGASRAAAVPDELRLAQPRWIEESYALEGEGELSGKTHVVVGWLLGPSIDLDTMLRANLLEMILLDNSSAPLLHALESSELGNAPSPMCGLDDSNREMLFSCGLEGSDPERAQEVEKLVLEVLAEVAANGVPQSQVEAMLHQLELSRREITGGGMPYGLRLMLGALPAALHGGNPVAMLAVDQALERLRAEIAQPGCVQRMVREQLLENRHRVLLVLRPDPHLNDRRRQSEENRLEEITKSLDPDERELIIRQALELAARQNQQNDPELLPKVELSDVPAELPIPTGGARPGDRLETAWYDQPTNGLVYQQVVRELPALDAELTALLPYYTACLTEVGSAGRDYRETQGRMAEVTGGINATVTVRSRVDDLGRSRGVITVSGKALARNHGELNRLLEETAYQPRFDELPRLRELVAQMRAAAELRITEHGHQLAMTAATGGINPTAALAERWGGMSGIKELRRLDRSLDDPAALAGFAARLEGIHHRVALAPPRLLIVGESAHFSGFESVLGGWAGRGGTALAEPFALSGAASRVAVGWVISSQVNFCAKAYPAVEYVHPDAPVLMVLAQLLRDGYLHRAVREQGGAYGGGASYDSDSGAFRFYSYRDPRLSATLEDFDRSREWLLGEEHPPRLLEEAILGVIGGIDRPGSPAGEAIQAYHAALHGRTPELRRRFRQRVLAVTMADLKRVAAEHLVPERASVAVVGNQTDLEGVAGLELKGLRE